MKIYFLEEPELEFGVDYHIDVRFGIMNYGPVDYAHQLAPKRIRVGIVGTNETIEGVWSWLVKCQQEIPAKPSKQPNLFPKFPGFRSDSGFQSTLITDDTLKRIVSPSRFSELARKITDINVLTREYANVFYEQLVYLSVNAKADVIICALPQVMLDDLEKPDEITDSNQREISTSYRSRIDFHDLLKAKAMNLRIPIQLIKPSTYDENKTKRQKKKNSPRKLQDEATRAWNIHTALYYKATGVPWRLIRNLSEYTTCFVGISFYKSLDHNRILTSVAQVFNERGEGFIVRGGPARLSKDDKQVHLEEDDAHKLLARALVLYREEHKTYPARVVVHKTSSFNRAEKEGLINAVNENHVDMVDLLSVGQSSTRLFRTGPYPPLRGTLLSLDEINHVLYTKGSVDFFETYPGMYIPNPLMFRCAHTQTTPKFLAEEILALTKMNWNNTQFDGSEPITIRAARQVGSILKYVSPENEIASTYRFYM